MDIFLDQIPELASKMSEKMVEDIKSLYLSGAINLNLREVRPTEEDGAEKSEIYQALKTLREMETDGEKLDAAIQTLVENYLSSLILQAKEETQRENPDIETRKDKEI